MLRRREPAVAVPGQAVPPANVMEAGAPIRQTSLWRDAWIRYLRNRGAVACGIVFLILLLYCILAPVFSPYDPNAVDFKLAHQSIGWHHPLGTDKYGRDLFTRTALGGRISIGCVR